MELHAEAFKLELSVQTWELVFSTVVNPTNGGPTPCGLRKFSALMRFASASKAYRELVVSFLVRSFSVSAEIESIVSDPSRVFGTYGSLPILGTPRPSRCEDAWSLLRSTSLRIFSTGSTVASDLSSLPPHASAATIVFNSPNVSFGTELELPDRIRCLIIDRNTADAREVREARERPAPVSGSILGPGVTHLVVSSKARELPSLACLRTPSVESLLIGCALGSLEGVDRLTCIRSLAVNGAIGAIGSIRHIGSLVHLTKLYVGFSQRAAFLKFTSDVLPVLATRSLRSLAVCTPGGAADHCAQTGARLTGLTALTSLRLNGLDYLPSVGTDDVTHEPWLPLEPSLPRLPPALTALAVYGTWFTSWEEQLTSITSLSLDSIETIYDPSLGSHRFTAPSTLDSGLNRLASLTSLTITRCSDLSSLTGIGARMRSLVELSVTDCTDLTGLDDLTRLTALKSLDIDIDLVAHRIPPARLQLPSSLRRLRFHSSSSISSLEPPFAQAEKRCLDFIARRFVHLRELSVAYWDDTFYQIGP